MIFEIVPTQCQKGNTWYHVRMNLSEMFERAKQAGVPLTVAELPGRAPVADADNAYVPLARYFTPQGVKDLEQIRLGVQMGLAPAIELSRELLQRLGEAVQKCGYRPDLDWGYPFPVRKDLDTVSPMAKALSAIVSSKPDGLHLDPVFVARSLALMIKMAVHHGSALGEVVGWAVTKVTLDTLCELLHWPEGRLAMPEIFEAGMFDEINTSTKRILASEAQGCILMDRNLDVLGGKRRARLLFQSGDLWKGPPLDEHSIPTRPESVRQLMATLEIWTRIYELPDASLTTPHQAAAIKQVVATLSDVGLRGEFLAEYDSLWGIAREVHLRYCYHHAIRLTIGSNAFLNRYGHPPSDPISELYDVSPFGPNMSVEFFLHDGVHIVTVLNDEKFDTGALTAGGLAKVFARQLVSKVKLKFRR